jgi:arsenate reductase (thioredoxin)
MEQLFGKSRKEAEVKGEEKTVLFVCVENVGRSQIAEAFFRKYAPRGYSTVSAGTSPAGKINPTAIQVMKEVGIDISKQKIKDNHRRDDKKCCCESKYGVYGQRFMSHTIHS